MSDIEQKLKIELNGLFDSGKINLAAGFENSALPGRTEIKFIDGKSGTDKLVWNSFCANNIAAFIPRFFVRDPLAKAQKVFPVIGIAAKGCDARSITGLIAENQIPKENVVVIGMPCAGMIDRKKLETQYPGDEIKGVEETGDSVDLTSAGGKKAKIKREEVLMDSCLECIYPAPDCVDLRIMGDSRAPAESRFGTVNRFEGKSIQERWEYFAGEFSKCIQCNACRQACPNCYCRECFIDQTKPAWAGKSDEISEVMLYHIGRIFHQAGRCVECGACAQACPMGIDLRLFTQKIAKDCEELFGYTAGLSWDARLPLTTFKEDDTQGFITDPALKKGV
jgi:formate dehydrogenase (coenzyme F420) beta subunit